MKSIAMPLVPLVRLVPRDPRGLRRYAPSTPPHQVRWIASARRRCPATALQPWHPSPARKSLHRVPLLLDAAFALRVRRSAPRARMPKVLVIRKMLASFG